VIYLVDTNVVLRIGPRPDPLRVAVRAAVRKLRGRGHSLVVTPQNLVEFWNVATRPVAHNGFGFSPAAADRRLRRVERLFPALPDSALVYPEWRRLVVAYRVSGVQVHDARLVAFMRIYGVDHILTLNTADFARYAAEGVVAVDPRTV
jgi:predicted nucleic acid-binding protein